jgi:hypothetical protein
MAPKVKQKIEIEKSHKDPLLSFHQAVTMVCSDFLGTALIREEKLVHLIRLVRRLVLIFDELCLVVTKCQQETTIRDSAIQLIFLSVNNHVYILATAADESKVR